MLLPPCHKDLQIIISIIKSIIIEPRHIHALVNFSPREKASLSITNEDSR
jgi:hypothetical protein